jgi:hypothetical protein
MVANKDVPGLNNNPRLERNYYPKSENEWLFRFRVVLFLLIIEGIVAILLNLRTFSMDKRAFLFRYSLVRLLALSGFASIVIALIVVLASSLMRPQTFMGRVRKIEELLFSNPHTTRNIIFGLTYLGSLGAFFLLQASGYYFRSTVVNATNRLFEPFLWVTLIPFQILVWIAIIYKREIRNAISSLIIPNLFLFTIITFTSMHWMTIILGSNIYQLIDGWFWKADDPKMLRFSFLMLPLMFCGAIYLARYAVKDPHRINRQLLIFVVMMYAFQFGFGISDGTGLKYIERKYANTPLSEHMRIACANEISLNTAIREYDYLFGNKYFLQTKPPGLLSLYIGMREVVNIFDPGMEEQSDVCFNSLVKAATVVLPLMAAFTLIPMYFIQQQLKNTSWKISAVLLLSAPNMLLMTLVPDQAFFPFAFMFAIYLLGLAIFERSLVWSLASGFFMGLAIFITFSLIPVLGFAGVWLVLEGVKSYRERRDTSILFTGLGIILGFVLLMGIIYVAYEYNPISRYQVAFHYHIANKSFKSSPAQLINNFVLNGIDFTFWSGVPIVLLFLASCVRLYSMMRRGNLNREGTFMLAFVVTLLGINLLGQTRSEVGRLWIFLLPIISIFSGRELEFLHRKLPGITELIVGLQWITVILMFIFWDFR